MVKKATAAKAATVATIVLMVETMKEKLVDKALKEADFAPADSVKLDRKAEMLDTHYRKTVAKEKLIACHKCGGHSSDELEACPFCGNKEEAPEAAAEKAAGEKVIAPAVALTLVPGTKMAKTGVKTVVAQNGVEFSEKALDEANQRITKLKQEGAANYWQLGMEIASVFDSQLWKARVESGKAVPAYKSFNQYVVKELRISQPTAYNMMKVAKAFTEDQVGRLGSTKLSFVLSIPDSLQEERDELIQEIEEGASAKEVKAKTRKVRQKHGVDRVERATQPGKTGKMPTSPGRPKGVAKDGKLTVAMVKGVNTLPLYVRPSVKLEPGQLPEKRAKKLGDRPFAIEQLENGVVRYYSVVNASGGLKLRIETMRPKA